MAHVFHVHVWTGVDSMGHRVLPACRQPRMSSGTA